MPAPVAEEPAPEALPLAYVEHVLGAEAEDTPWVLAIHGLGDRPDAFWRVLEGAPEPLRIVAVQAPDPWGRGFSWFPYGQVSAAEREAGMRASTERLSDFLRAWKERHPLAPKPVVMGFSQGGMLSFALALRHPDQLSLAIPLGGLLPEALLAESPPAGPKPPIRALHGAED